RAPRSSATACCSATSSRACGSPCAARLRPSRCCIRPATTTTASCARSCTGDVAHATAARRIDEPAMLTLLQIRDFAIIESVEIQFRAGFTALTGETGAGKSILVDALLLAIGGRGDSTVVRHGAERAQITAGFDVSANPAARAWLDEQSIDTQDECLLAPLVGADGRRRAWIYGPSMPGAALRS